MHRKLRALIILLVLFAASYSHAAVNFDQQITNYDAAKSRILQNLAGNSSYPILENQHYKTISRLSNDINRNRYYSPALGRFTSKDPIGFNGGNNLYRYADNNPVVYIDSYGENPLLWGLAGIAGLGALGEWIIPALNNPNSNNNKDLGKAIDKVAEGFSNAAEYINRDVKRALDPGGINRMDDLCELLNRPFQSNGNSSGRGNNSYSGESGSPNGPDDPNWGNGFKKPKPGATGKKGSTDRPSWAKGKQPKVGQSGNDFATECMNTRYGKGNWSRNGSQAREYSQLRKYADRHFK